MPISKPLLFVASLLLCLVGGELALRAIARGSGVADSAGHFAPYVPDGLLGYRLKADWRGDHRHPDFSVGIRTNELGMRGAPAVRDKPADAYRILLLGDSYGFGFGVEEEESLARLLEDQLRASSTSRVVEVLNAAVPGYAADHHSIYLRERGFDLSPDLVLVALYENDVDDLGWSTLTLGPDRLPTRTQSRLRMIDRRGRMRYVNESGIRLPGWLGEPPRWLQDHSYLFNWLRIRIARLWVAAARGRAEARNAVAAGSPPDGTIESLSPDEIARGLASGDAFRARYHDFLMDALETSAKQRGIAFRSVNVPSERGHLQQHCRARSQCFDLALLFTRESDPELFLPNDGHWTAEGHRRTAEAIATWLQRDAALGLAPAVH